MARTIFYVFGLLIFGCLNTLTTKIQFTIQSRGLGGQEKLFAKPEFGTFAMFVGMSVVLVVHYCSEWMGRTRTNMKADLALPLVSPARDPPVSQWKAFMYIGIPANLDLFASILMFFGLLYVPASVWQMLRGSMIVFSSIESVVFLGRVMKSQHIIGILTCVMGICCVGLASYISAIDETRPLAHASTEGDNKSSTQAVVFGMVIIILGQIVQATQVVAEEVLMKDVNLPPLQIVGFEGLWGVLMCMFVVFPICYYIPGSDAGSFENSLDTIEMLSNSQPLVYLVLIYTFSCATYNISGMLVTSSLSAVHRTMLEASRTAVIWMVDLAVYYCVSDKILFGEQWNRGSYLQLLGFLLLLCGQSIYGEVLKLPCCTYESQFQPELLKSPTSLRTSTALPRKRLSTSS